MLKITSTNKQLSDVAKKYVRLIITEEPASTHRFVETADSTCEYRMGVGKYKAMTPRKFRTFVRSIVQAAKSHEIEYLAIQLSRSPFPKLNVYSEDWVVGTIAENLLLADYTFTTYKSKTKKKRPELKEVLICGGLNKAAAAGLKRGITVATGVNTTRDIANGTAQDITPRGLATAAKKALKGTKVSIKVLGESELKKLKVNLLLAVGQGTKEPTQMIVMTYWGAGKPTKQSPKSKQPIALIGKGITYDTGGLNVRPTGAMHDMHMDMSGGAAIVGTMQAVAKLGLKKNVIGIIPAAENAVSAEAMRAGDIFTAMNGTTVEVLHTDAEGRLALADALTYSERFTPRCVIDVATLTGASLVALGQQASAIMTPDIKLQDTLQELGEASGDYVWPLPLWDEYQKPLKSTRADLANIATNFSRFGGTIEGGAFLQNFAPTKTPWCHIDMAPRMESIPGEKLAKGATGEPVRLLTKFVETY